MLGQPELLSSTSAHVRSSLVVKLIELQDDRPWISEYVGKIGILAWLDRQPDICLLLCSVLNIPQGMVPGHLRMPSWDWLCYCFLRQEKDNPGIFCQVNVSVWSVYLHQLSRMDSQFLRYTRVGLTWRFHKQRIEVGQYMATM